MIQSCPNCGSPNSATNKFCSNCGTALQLAASAPPSPSQESTLPEPAPSATPMVFGDTGQTNTEEAAAAPPPTAYVVKTSEPESSATDLQAPTMPMSTYVPPPAPPVFTPFVPPGQEQPQPMSGTGTGAGYQGYTPGASGRTEGAAFTPYSAGTVTALEKPKDQRSLLVPVIIVAALALIGLAAFSGWLVLNNKTANPVSTGKSPSPVPTTAAEPTKVPANAPEADKVKEVVRVSNDEQIKAWRDLDEDVLKDTRAGAVLNEQIDMVRQLKAANMYAIPVNTELIYLDVKVTGDTATVRTRETWTVDFYRKADNKKIEHRGPDVLTETYYLSKQNGKWLITKLTFDQQITPTPTPGGN